MTHKVIINRINTLLKEDGQGMIEYVLIIGFIALAVIASLTPMGKTLAVKFTEFTAAISGN